MLDDKGTLLLQNVGSHVPGDTVSLLRRMMLQLVGNEQLQLHQDTCFDSVSKLFVLYIFRTVY